MNSKQRFIDLSIYRDVSIYRSQRHLRADDKYTRVQCLYSNVLINLAVIQEISWLYQSAEYNHKKLRASSHP